MKIETKYFGEMELLEDEIVHFPQGIFGFEDNKSFVIIRFENDNDSLLCLQSVTDELLAFVLMNPFYVKKDYKPELSTQDSDDLKINSDTPVSLYAITVVHDKFEKSTINLKCPIVVNCNENLAKQVVLDTNEYSLRHPIASGRTENGQC